MSQLNRSLVILVCCMATGLIQAQSQGNSNDLTYRRDEARRQPVRQPRVESLPSELMIERSKSGNDGMFERADGAGTTVRRGGRPSRVPRGEHSVPTRSTSNVQELERQANKAADQMARQLSQGYGFREYYQLGFYKGMHRALNDPGLGHWDYRQGQRSGARDPEVVRYGDAVGGEAAEQDALQRAEKDVAQEFHDLSREPNRRPPAHLAPPPFNAPLSQPGFPEPTMTLVFEALPIQSFDWYGRSHHFHERWQPHPVQLYAFSSYDRFFDQRWRDADHALQVWCSDRQNARTFNRLNDNDKQAFTRSFKQAFQQYLPEYFHRYTLPGHELGWRDGWSYGAAVNYEWSFRRGYHEGALQGVQHAATSAFQRSWPRAYQHHYQQQYRQWQNQAVIEIQEVSTVDGNDDGVLEPGEAFVINYSLVNYGGAAANWNISLEGAQLMRQAQNSISIPARRQFRPRHGLPAKIPANAPTGQNYQATLLIGPLKESLHLPVAYPLQLDEAFEISERDNLAGHISIEVHVQNISRREVNRIVVASQGRRQNLSQLGPGESLTLSFQYDRLSPLELLAGKVTFDVSVTSGAKRHDQRIMSIPEQVTDLANRDLLIYMVQLAREGRGNSQEITQVQDLMIQRLQQDWLAAIRARGNPYKQDWKRGGTKTALGDLVKTFQSQRRGLRDPSVFSLLHSRLQHLSHDLPGNHPMLRKHFRRLADGLK